MDPLRQQQQQQPQLASSSSSSSTSTAASWFPSSSSSQFQFHPCPSPPPPPPQWMPQPSLQHQHQHQHQHQMGYGGPYAIQPQFGGSYPPMIPPSSQYHGHGSMPPPQQPPHFPPPAQFTQPPQLMYAQPDQSWGNPNWPHNQYWEYPGYNVPHGNEEDWAAKARAWAASKAAADNQHMQMQFMPVGRSDEHQYHAYHEHQNALQPPADVHQHLQAPNPIGFPVPDADLTRKSAHFHDTQQLSPELSAYNRPNLNDKTYAPDTNTVSAASQGSIFDSTSYQQELPSNFSSFSGEPIHEYSQSQFSAPVAAVSSQDGRYHLEPMISAAVRPASIEPPRYLYGSTSAEPSNDENRQSSEYAMNLVNEYGQHQKVTYPPSDPAIAMGGLDTSAATAIHSWAAPVPNGHVGSIAHPIPPFAPPVPQGEPFVSLHAIPRPPAPLFGGLTGPNYPPPSAGPFGLGPGVPLPGATTFPIDANGVFGVSERPKKASVPSWLREEIMKKKAAVIANSVQESEFSLTSDNVDIDDKVFKRTDEEDDRIIDITKSTEDEDDEDELEAARIAALNQDIKRILTEILLKVTDDLFREVAVEVIQEDDFDEVTENNRSSSSPPPLTSKASAKILVPAKINMSGGDTDDESDSSTAEGNVLGLVNYDSDEADNSGIRSKTASQFTNGENKASSKEHERVPQFDAKELIQSRESSDRDTSYFLRGSILGSGNEFKSDTVKLLDDSLADISKEKEQVSGQLDAVAHVPETELERNSDAHSKSDTLSQPNLEKSSDCSRDKNSKKKSTNNEPESSRKSANDEPESSKNSSNNRHSKEVVEPTKLRAEERPVESSDRKKQETVRRDKTHGRKEAGNGRRDKDRDAKLIEKPSNVDTRELSSHTGLKEDRKRGEKEKTSGQEGSDRKRDRSRGPEGNGPKHVEKRDSNKRRRSPSPHDRGNRGIHSSGSESSGASYETAQESRRMSSSKHDTSASRDRSRSRHVSRSPPSRHSQRRHSPYNSHHARYKARKRSRSGSPARRRR